MAVLVALGTVLATFVGGFLALRARDWRVPRETLIPGTGDRTRTYTPSLARDFESPASTIPPHRHVGAAIIA